MSTKQTALTLDAIELKPTFRCLRGSRSGNTLGAARPPSARNKGCGLLRDAPVDLLEQLCVRVASELDRGVPKYLLHREDVAAAGMGERGRQVAEVAEVDRRQSRPLVDPAELVRHLLGVKPCAVKVGPHLARVYPVRDALPLRPLLGGGAG